MIQVHSPYEINGSCIDEMKFTYVMAQNKCAQLLKSTHNSCMPPIGRPECEIKAESLKKVFQYGCILKSIALNKIS